MTERESSDIVVPLVPLAGVDDVGLVREAVPRGTPVRTAEGVHAALEDIPAGHKVAVRTIDAGARVRKYGEVIGIARREILPGSHVHVHNLGLASDGTGGATGPVPPHAPGSATWQAPAVPSRTHFLGYRRPDGRAATRNYIAVLPTVNCSATVARLIAQAATEQHRGTPGLDGVIALSHDLGCGMAEGTAGDDILRRTLRGYAGHANIAGILMISLGCEINQPENVFDGGPAVETLSIQELGGSAATVNAALERIAALDALGLARRDTVVAETEWFAAYPRVAGLEGAPAPADYRRVLGEAAARGVTGLIDFEFGAPWSDWAQRWHEGCDLLRIRWSPYQGQLDSVRAAGLRSGGCLPGAGDRLSVGSLKIISDGSLGTRTAWCHEPYADTGGRRTGRHACRRHAGGTVGRDARDRGPGGGCRLGGVRRHRCARLDRARAADDRCGDRRDVQAWPCRERAARASSRRP